MMSGDEIKAKLKRICRLIDGKVDPSWLRSATTQFAVPVIGLTITGLSWGQMDRPQPMYGVPIEQESESEQLCRELIDRIDREDRSCQDAECEVLPLCRQEYPHLFEEPEPEPVTGVEDPPRAGCRRR